MFTGREIQQNRFARKFQLLYKFCQPFRLLLLRPEPMPRQTEADPEEIEWLFGIDAHHFFCKIDCVNEVNGGDLPLQLNNRLPGRRMLLQFISCSNRLSLQCGLSIDLRLPSKPVVVTIRISCFSPSLEIGRDQVTPVYDVVVTEHHCLFKIRNPLLFSMMA